MSNTNEHEESNYHIQHGFWGDKVVPNKMYAAPELIFEHLQYIFDTYYNPRIPTQDMREFIKLDIKNSLDFLRSLGFDGTLASLPPLNPDDDNPYLYISNRQTNPRYPMTNTVHMIGMPACGKTTLFKEYLESNKFYCIPENYSRAAEFCAAYPSGVYPLLESLWLGLTIDDYMEFLENNPRANSIYSESIDRGLTGQELERLKYRDSHIAIEKLKSKIGDQEIDELAILVERGPLDASLMSCVQLLINFDMFSKARIQGSSIFSLWYERIFDKDFFWSQREKRNDNQLVVLFLNTPKESLRNRPGKRINSLEFRENLFNVYLMFYCKIFTTLASDKSFPCSFALINCSGSLDDTRRQFRTVLEKTGLFYES